MTGEKSLKYRYFLLSFSVAFLVLSLMFFFLMNAVHPSTPPSLERKLEEAAMPSVESYIPTAADTLTVLFIGAPAREASAGSYILARFDPVTGSVPIVAFPRQTLVEGPSGAETLSDLYRYGGAEYVRGALAATLGVDIDRYARLSVDAFISAADTIGAVEFDLPYELVIGEPGMQVTLRRGKQLLDGKKVSEIIRCETYEGGELTRCAVAGDLAAAIVDQRMDVALSTLADNIFERVINLIDTDISYPDYENRKMAAQFMARLEQKPAKPLPVGGSFSENKREFTLSDTFIAELRHSFG